MQSLPSTAPAVHDEFMNGNFAVKRSNDTFNQVSADQALEWLNKSCKVAGGLIGITRNETARDKWSLTFNEKANIAECTRELFGCEHDEVNAPTRNDSLPCGMNKDEDDVKAIGNQLKRFGVLVRLGNCAAFLRMTLHLKQLQQIY